MIIKSLETLFLLKIDLNDDNRKWFWCFQHVPLPTLRGVKGGGGGDYPPLKSSNFTRMSIQQAMNTRTYFQ